MVGLVIFFGGVAFVGIAFVVAYKINKNKFWERQDFMEKINRMF